ASAGVVGAAAAMPAITCEVFAKMPHQMTNDAAGLFGKLDNLTDAVDVVAFARFKALNQFPFQSGNIGWPCFDSVPLAQTGDFERQVTLFFKIVQRFDDARPGRAEAINRRIQVDSE